MRYVSLALVVLGGSAFADEKTKPNALTPKEFADGWVLLFDGETTFGFDVNKRVGKNKATNGELLIGDDLEIATFNTQFGPCEIRLEVSDDGKNWSTETHWIDNAGKKKAEGGLPFAGGKTRLPFGGFAYPGDPRDGGPRFGFIGVGGKTHVRSVRCRPTNMTPLFNGKDLSGWKEFKPTNDKKVASKFSVTKEGWLNVKNGPGDLQTEGQWADFVVQFECISNGKHLNSGLFFRCIPDQYQQGYDAQIRNQWEGDDRTKPVDFGTGAIYRRQAARKVVSTDGEWFTMTVAAHGRHIATWVNGYQVTDWTDDRKENDNARNGFKKGKGALSIQGHDPTTDLSFRNIRIQSLDK